MQIFPAAEGLNEPFILRQVGHDAHLDLRVVGGEESFVALSGDEDLADAFTLICPHRNVLEIRVC